VRTLFIRGGVADLHQPTIGTMRLAGADDLKSGQPLVKNIVLEAFRS
jgi:hypothetical protein